METPYTFSWSNLTLWVNETRGSFWKNRTTKRYILEKEFGRLESNSLVAIMGPSGVGKTTFLAALAGKNKEMIGKIQLNDRVLPHNHIKNLSGYVFQDDICVDSLTVMEHMTFMSALKGNKNKNTLDIHDIIKELNLDTCQNNQIKSLSGGERKRVALGAELLNDPLLLFCDEPTTGLDSYSAVIIINMLKSRAMKGKLILVTIHQPSTQLFEYFNYVILISHRKIFFQGLKSQVAEYFKSLGLICPTSYNPAEFYIKCVSNQPQGKHFITYRNWIFENECTEKFKCSISSKNINNCFCYELYWLLWRCAIDTKRKFGFHVLQFTLLMVTAIILAIFYSYVDTEHESAVQNIKGIMFFFTSELIFTHTYNVVNTFPGEYEIILREKELYSTNAYFVSKVLAIVPRNIIQPFTFLVINFILVDFLSGISMFFKMYGILFCSCIAGSILGLCISAVFSSLEYMDLFIAPFELVTMLAAGILIKVDSLVYFNWIKYLSPFYYTYESLSITYWSKINIIECLNTSLVCYKSGQEVLKDLGFMTDSEGILWDLLYMAMLSTIIGLIAYSTILYKRKMHASY